jgi:hypothetical protein
VLLLLDTGSTHRRALQPGGLLAAFFIGENMTINPTESKRTVVLEIQTINANQPEPNCAGSAGTGIIIAIGVIVDDGMEIMEDSFSNASEIDLLRGFWHVVRSYDVFVGFGIAKIWPFSDNVAGK